MPKVNPAKLIIGLGNPDKQYEKTYHNVGFLAIDYMAENTPISNLLKSDVFMNQSGLFISKTVKKYGVKPKELVIIHDDTDIEIGKYKLSFGRNSAGHRGAQSIIDSLGTKDFWRLRIGIGKTAKKIKAEKIVLKKISKNDLEILKKTFAQIKLNTQ